MSEATEALQRAIAAEAAIPELEAVIERLQSLAGRTDAARNEWRAQTLELRAEVERLREALWARDVVRPAGPVEACDCEHEHSEHAGHLVWSETASHPHNRAHCQPAEAAL